MFMRSIFNKASNICFCVAALMHGAAVASQADSPEDGSAVAKGLVWGEVTNQLWAGVGWETRPFEQGSLQDVRILIQTAMTNGIGGYFLPPEHTLANAELRDAKGALLVPLHGKQLESDLPGQIRVSDLPRSPPRGIHHPVGMLLNGLHLTPKLPETLWNFSIQDIYRIEQEGDYTFTVVVALYHITNDGELVVRIDLPPVTVKMHLGPSPPEGSVLSTGGEAWGAVTNQFCAGLLWETKARGHRPFQDLRIAVKTSNLKERVGYFVPASNKLAKFELRDAAGTVLAPVNGKKLDGDLPRQILAMGRSEASVISHTVGAPGDPLVLFQNVPTCPWDVSIQDIYHIEKEGDYTLSVIVALYHFTADEQSVVRMDLPPVTARLHLTPSQK
jgi:hypothetical protein